MKVQKNWLLLAAGIVWLFAGSNIIKIAFQVANGVWHFTMFAVALVVFCIFFFFIFGRLVGKHTHRILGFHDEKVWIFKAFDIRSYIIMAVMITLGIVIRRFQLMPSHCIAMFYAGLGSALVAAGVVFAVQFAKANRLK